jgi:hypothetical protein
MHSLRCVSFGVIGLWITIINAIFHNILGEKIDFDVFKFLNQADIYEILKDYPVGIRKKVYQSYEVWLANYSSRDMSVVSRVFPQSDTTAAVPETMQQSSKDGVSSFYHILNSFITISII